MKSKMTTLHVNLLWRALCGALCGVCLWACGPDDETNPKPATEPVFAADFASHFVEVRGCRQSIEHELEYVKLFVDPDSVAFFNRCVVPNSPCNTTQETFPEGATLVKTQYLDPGCTELLRYSAVQKDASQAANGGGWRWQEVSVSREVLLDGSPSACVSCHQGCDPAFDLRCVMDP